MAFLFCTAMSGCSSREELGNVTVITGFFLDYQPKEKQYFLLAEMADFSDYEKTSSLSAKWLEASGKSVKEVFSALQKKATKELCFSHAEVLLFGKNIKQSALLLEELMQEPALNRDIVLALTDATFEAIKEEASPPVCKTVSERLTKENTTQTAKLYQLYQKNDAFRLLPKISIKETVTLNQS